MNKLMMWGLVVVALIVGAVGGFYFEKSRAAANIDTIKMAMQKEVDDAKMMQQVTPTGMMMQEPLMMAKAGFETDPKGMTLYTYDKDTSGQSTCYGGCATAWPPYLVGDTKPSTSAHVGTTKRTDGSMQYTWDGKPLYYYQGDKKSGDMTGDGIGGVWHLVK